MIIMMMMIHMMVAMTKIMATMTNTGIKGPQMRTEKADAYVVLAAWQYVRCR